MSGDRIFRFAGRVFYPTLGILGLNLLTFIGSLLIIIVSAIAFRDDGQLSAFGIGVASWALTILISFLLLRALEARNPNRFRIPAILSVGYGAFAAMFWSSVAENNDAASFMLIGMLYSIYSVLGLWLYIGTIKYPSLQLFD